VKSEKSVVESDNEPEDAALEEEEINSTKDEKSRAGNTNFVSCRYCTDIIKSNESVHKHVKRFHKTVNYFRCPHCPRRFKKAGKIMQKHFQTLHRSDCQICKKYILHSTKPANKILEQQVEKRRNCVYCGKLVKHMWLHVRESHQSEAIRCDFRNCGTYFRTESARAKHVANLH